MMTIGVLQHVPLAEGRRVTLLVNGLVINGTVTSDSAFSTAQGLSTNQEKSHFVYLKDVMLGNDLSYRKTWFCCRKSDVQAVLIAPSPEQQSTSEAAIDEPRNLASGLRP